MIDIHLGSKRGRVVAVVDIGSTSAAVAIVHTNPHESATVFASERAQLPLEERTQEATIAGIGEMLKTAGENAQKKYAVSKGGGAPIQAIYCIVHAPWTSSKTIRTAASFEKDTTITDIIISDLAKKALGEAGVDAKNLLEANVIRVELNGYPTGKPIGKHAKEIVVHALLSECAAGIRSGIEGAISKVFPHAPPPVFHSATRAAITSLRDGVDSESNYLLVDMESEGTSLTAVRGGVTAEHEHVAEGTQTILKKIAGAGMPEETLSLLRMIARDQCSLPACEALLTSLTKVEPDLVRIFGEAMGKAGATNRLPDTMILIAHPDMFPWLSRLFSRIDFSQFTLTAQPFVVKKMSNTASGTEDPNLALAIEFVNRGD
ncbi:hypothetical protein COU18_02715 [Candidatus Kaiserbacteria bacterium CG10_big_fil_rev_8_21_14_0_10_51_14]|uniref:SHS2 domain-containing protein n=1 Tax=Candidatus Kaiserbacteria bacterium CG10_big_fil_rev_8_21_14_0_10_51_14 TaxID=1974610 RepID=A0A2H0UAZ8_9BACT|nr:MAG: hypothetical protein COU18_02715 [Candidatus Kaiserbacteria bacterium CG10_big_fil_rev_8_21_14_0_10_51_14]